MTKDGGRRTERGNKKSALGAGIGLMLALVLALAAPLAAAGEAGSFFALNTGDLKAELADARSEGKRAVLLFFEQEGCPGCRHMKQSVFPRAAVRDYYRRHFLSLTVDIHGAVPLVDFAGRQLPEKAYAQALKIRGTPTFVFFDLSGAEVVRIAGVVDTPEEFLVLGEFVASGAYRRVPFTQYKLERQSERRSRTPPPGSSPQAGSGAVPARLVAHAR